jgi:hypothetical protein
MGDPLQASNAWSMGNVGLSTVLRDDVDGGGYDIEDMGAPDPRPWLVRLRWRLFRWALAAGVFFALINHWPGGAH